MHGSRRVSYKDWIDADSLKKLEAYARDGLTDEQISHNIGIHVGTLWRWKKKYSEIGEALKRGKQVVDIEVENALYKRAIGYEYEETKTYIEETSSGQKKRVEKIKKVALPDTTAQIFWLKNRKPVEWRDRQQLEHSGQININERAKQIEEYLRSDHDEQ